MKGQLPSVLTGWQCSVTIAEAVGEQRPDWDEEAAGETVVTRRPHVEKPL